jgi:hypothetical protein
MTARYALCAGGRSRARLILGLLAAALLAACASRGAPAELIGTWRLLRANGPIPEGCSTATLTFHRDGTFEGSSGTLETRGRYVASGGKKSYRLKLEQLQYSGAENCQGFTAHDMQAETINVLDLAFEREAHDIRLSAPLPSDAYIVYTRAN